MPNVVPVSPFLNLVSKGDSTLHSVAPVSHLPFNLNTHRMMDPEAIKHDGQLSLVRSQTVPLGKSHLVALQISLPTTAHCKVIKRKSGVKKRMIIIILDFSTLTKAKRTQSTNGCASDVSLDICIGKNPAHFELNAKASSSRERHPNFLQWQEG